MGDHSKFKRYTKGSRYLGITEAESRYTHKARWSRAQTEKNKGADKTSYSTRFPAQSSGKLHYKGLQVGSLPKLIEGGEPLYMRAVSHPCFLFPEGLLAVLYTTILS